ncbi:restriction endonuclease subunit S [Nocardioides sp. SYSU DS0651]|uniref:restriction endonuclease subunit S n=1 Tax=Nocardioides sp. SYSU DS0651 TaxID=3415955 RepID=UPI003F4BF60C
MKTVALGEVVRFYSGGTPSKARSDFWNGDVPWFSAKDMKRSRLTNSANHITEDVFSETPLRKVPAGTVAMVVRGMILAHTVPISILDVDAAINQDLKALIPKRELDASFLAAMLRAQHDTILSQVSTAAHGTKKLDARVLEDLQIPLPPLPEQRRIAAILDRADALRAKRRQVLAELDSLHGATFLSMFGDPANNPLGFPTAPVGSLSLKFSDGPFGSNLKSSHYTPDGVPVVRLQNIGVGRYLDADRAYVAPSHYATLSKHDCKPGDVLIGTLGDPNLRACIQPPTMALALNKADCIQMRVDPEVATPEYACWLLNMPGTLALANSLVRGQTRSRISMGRLRDLLVPVPPIEMQRTFAAQIERIDSHRALVARALESEEQLFASLQSRAFRGEL